MTIAGSGFGDVDHTDDPAALVQYLDVVTGAASIQAYKRRTLALLQLRPGHRVLDIGCGAGDDTRAIAEMVGLEGGVVGMDNSETMVEEARRRGIGAAGQIAFRAGDAHTLDEPADSFDAARADRVFQHLAEPARALSELVRVVRPGGWIVVSDPDWETLVVDVPNRSVTRAILNAHRETLRNPWMGRQLRRLFLEAGLIDPVVEIVTPQVTDLEMGAQALYLGSSPQTAAAAGDITAEQASTWLRHLETAASEARFFAAMSVFIAAGRVPS